MRLTLTILTLIAGLTLLSSCRGVGGFADTDPGGRNLRIGDVAEWNITGTPPFNFEVHQRYGPYQVGRNDGFQTREYWENNTVAVNTTNTTIRWVVPERDYGRNWTINPWVQDSSDNRTWNRWFEQSISTAPINSGSSLKSDGVFAFAIVVAISTTSAMI